MLVYNFLNKFVALETRNLELVTFIEHKVIIMKIAILGYGKMGKVIEGLALAAGHEIVLKVNTADQWETAQLAVADVAIEFSRPEAVFQNLLRCFEAGVPVVSGTTGWLDQFDEAKRQCQEKKAGFFYASNFSIGVNLFFAVNRYLAQLMNPQTQYNPSMTEIHHTQKLDAPSGTAITLAQGILANLDRKTNWINQATDQNDTLGIVSERIDQVPGTHHIIYQSPEDRLELKHTAHTREGFAKGALLAAEWMIDKQGYYDMKDLLGL